MDVARLTSSLIRIRSENPPGNTADYLSTFIDEFFDPKFIRQLYNTSSLARLFDEYVRNRPA